MPRSMPFIVDHSRHELYVEDLKDTLDVLCFEGEEQLSQIFTYRIEFTCINQDLSAELFLGQKSSFCLYAEVLEKPFVFPEFPEPPAKPLRRLCGVITGFQRLGASNDEARYEVTLQPRLALLARGKQCRQYQRQSVPQIVEKVLRERHGFLTGDYLFRLAREYPRRPVVIQYEESDLDFICRLLAEVGIWFHFTSNERLNFDVLELHDDARFYQHGPELPQRPMSGMFSGDSDCAWDLQTQHQIVEKYIHVRSYSHRHADQRLGAEVSQLGPVSHPDWNRFTYGEAYHYGELYTQLGDKYIRDEDLLTESGYFYARLRHERYLNEQTRLTGGTDCASLALAQVLKITDGAPQAFVSGAVLTRLVSSARRDSTLAVRFEAIPYNHRYCYRPPVPPKPRIAGTLPARVTSTRANDLYGHIDLEGCYRVNFLFDRDKWDAGFESPALRLARPYAGDTYGLHMPLIVGTEVAIAFEQGDPDRPYIAHALHDSQHPDHVNLLRRDFQRNVLRTPANNKFRLEDARGFEHIKLSTEHSGKSQLNLGHLVDADRVKRGEGFELRTDGWGAIRAGKGLLISADEQGKAKGGQLDMEAAIDQLQSALSLARSLAQAARSAESAPSDTDSQVRLSQALKGLAQPGMLLYAPAGIGVISPEAVCLSSGAESVGIMAAHNTDISAGRDFTATAEGSVSVLAHKGDLQLKAASGTVELHAQSSNLHALANTDIKIESVQGRVEISAPQELVLNCGGAYIRLKDGEIELGCPGNIYFKAANLQKQAGASLDTPPTPLPSGYSGDYALNDEAQVAMPFTRYRITTAQGEVFNGVTDRDGQTMSVHTLVPGEMKIEFPDNAVYDEQLRLVGPDGAPASGIKYQAVLADGSLLEGESDETGHTQRLQTAKPIQIKRLKLMPPEHSGTFCCAALNVQEPLEIDLDAQKIFTNDQQVGKSKQDILLPKGKSRKLTAGEIAMARTVFKDAVDYAKVKVHHGGWWLFMGLQDTAATPNGEMYYPPSTGMYRDDFSSTDRPRDKALFIHELTHVWQYQLGYAVKWAGITVTRHGIEAYRYTLKDGARLSDFNMEQQAEIISDYYMICILDEPRFVWNDYNKTQSPERLTSTLQFFMSNPESKKNLPN